MTVSWDRLNAKALWNPIANALIHATVMSFIVFLIN